jgi:hypothetical protein
MTIQMWPKSYKDYPMDGPLIKNQVEPGKGIIGCEMHEINGWGNTYHIKRKPKRRRLIRTLLQALFSKF